MEEDESITSRLINKKNHHKRNNSSFKHKLRASLRLFLYCQRSYEAVLGSIDEQKTNHDIDLVNRIPGYKKYQLLFLYFYRNYGLALAFLLALLFPLPLTIVFYLIGGHLPFIQFSNQFEIVLIGLRCSVVSYLCRYCFHFPNQTLNWLIYVGSFVLALFSCNNNTFIIIYLVAIGFSWFKRENIKSRESTINDEQQERIQAQALAKVQLPQIPYKQYFLYLLIGTFIIFWFAERFAIHSPNGFHIWQLFIVSLLGTNQQMSIFYLEIFSHIHANPQLLMSNYFSLGYLAPGLHLKTLFLLFYQQSFQFTLLAYLAIHLPSLLLVCVGIGYKQFFYSLLWKKITQSIQAVSNGLILVGVLVLISQQVCHRNITIFTSLVIFTVTKLYKFNQLISSILGVFLVASRASVLKFSNKRTIQAFLACKAE